MHLRVCENPGSARVIVRRTLPDKEQSAGAVFQHTVGVGSPVIFGLQSAVTPLATSVEFHVCGYIFCSLTLLTCRRQPAQCGRTDTRQQASDRVAGESPTMRTSRAVATAALVCACWTAAAALAAPPALVRRETKRDVADKLILLAEEHKERSLHDVLQEREKRAAPGAATATAGTEKRERDGTGRRRKVKEGPVLRERLVRRTDGSMGAEAATKGPGAARAGSGSEDVEGKSWRAKDGSSSSSSSSASRSSARRGPNKKKPSQRAAPKQKAREGEHLVVNSWSEQFGRGVNATVRHIELAAYVNTSSMVVTAAARHAAPESHEQTMPVLRRTETAPANFAAALFGGPVRPASTPPALVRSMTAAALPGPAFAALDGWELDESEAGVMLRALRVLEASPVDAVDARVRALSILEEACRCYILSRRGCGHQCLKLTVLFALQPLSFLSFPLLTALPRRGRSERPASSRRPAHRRR
jgi:hypothetical protein